MVEGLEVVEEGFEEVLGAEVDSQEEAAFTLGRRDKTCCYSSFVRELAPFVVKREEVM